MIFKTTSKTVKFLFVAVGLSFGGGMIGQAEAHYCYDQHRHNRGEKCMQCCHEHQHESWKLSLACLDWCGLPSGVDHRDDHHGRRDHHDHDGGGHSPHHDSDHGHHDEHHPNH
jgi:hypothetical protein